MTMKTQLKKIKSTHKFDFNYVSSSKVIFFFSFRVFIYESIFNKMEGVALKF